MNRRRLLISLLVSAAVIASVEPALAAVAFVNYTFGGQVSGAASVSATAANHTTGNCILVAVSRTVTDVVTVTDTALNTYTQAGSTFIEGGTHNMSLFYCYNITGNASNVVTATTATNPADFFVIEVYQFSGMGTTALVGTNQTATGTGTTASTASLTLTNSSGVVFCNVICETPGAFSAGAGFSGNTNGVSGLDYFFTQYKIVSVSTAPSCTTGNNNWGMQAGIFNGPSGGGSSSSFGGLTAGFGVGH